MTTLPDTMRGAILVGPEQIDVRDVDVPRPGNGEILLGRGPIHRMICPGPYRECVAVSLHGFGQRFGCIWPLGAVSERL